MPPISAPVAPNYSGIYNSIENAGVWAGLAKGLQSGLLAYQGEKARQRDEAKQDKLYKLGLLKAGVEEGQNGDFIPSKLSAEMEEAKARRDAAHREADNQLKIKNELISQGLQAHFNDKGEIEDTRPVPGWQDLAQVRQSQQQAFQAGENEKNRKNALAVAGVKAQSAKGLMGNGKMLTPSALLKANEGNSVPRTLGDLGKSIQSNKDLFGPVSGRFAGMNPYNERARTLDANLRATSQQIGRYLEGGVLRKEDEEKYRKMLPQLSDTPEVAANKLALVDRLVRQKQASDVRALKDAGYDTNSLEQLSGEAPELPQVLRAKAPNRSAAKPDFSSMSDEQLKNYLGIK